MHRDDHVRIQLALQRGIRVVWAELPKEDQIAIECALRRLVDPQEDQLAAVFDLIPAPVDIHLEDPTAARILVVAVLRQAFQ